MLDGPIDRQALQSLVRHVLKRLDELFPYRLGSLLRQWRQFARQAALRGKRVAIVPPEAYCWM